MPYYRFTVPAGSPSAHRKQEIAEAFTAVHAEVTGAPESFVHCSFTEVGPGSIFVSGKPVEQGRVIGIIRTGRSEDVKRRLLRELARAWSEVSGEPRDGFGLFLHEVPGYHMLEDGEFLPEA